MAFLTHLLHSGKQCALSRVVDGQRIAKPKCQDPRPLVARQLLAISYEYLTFTPSVLALGSTVGSIFPRPPAVQWTGNAHFTRASHTLSIMTMSWDDLSE